MHSKFGRRACHPILQARTPCTVRNLTRLQWRVVGLLFLSLSLSLVQRVHMSGSLSLASMVHWQAMELPLLAGRMLLAWL